MEEFIQIAFPKTLIEFHDGFAVAKRDNFEGKIEYTDSRISINVITFDGNVYNLAKSILHLVNHEDMDIIFEVFDQTNGVRREVLKAATGAVAKQKIKEQLMSVEVQIQSLLQTKSYLENLLR